MATPPSMPINEAILPERTIRSTSADGERQFQVAGILVDQPVNQVDLLGDGARWVLVLAGDIDRPELSLDSPLTEPGDVGLSRVEPLREIVLRERHVAFGPQPPGQVVVTVPEDPLGVNLAGSFGDGRLGLIGLGGRTD